MIGHCNGSLVEIWCVYGIWLQRESLNPYMGGGCWQKARWEWDAESSELGDLGVYGIGQPHSNLFEKLMLCIPTNVVP